VVQGNSAMAVERFTGFRVTDRGNRRSPLEGQGGPNPRLITRWSGSLYDPVCDDVLLTSALELKDFYLAVLRDDRFSRFFDSKTHWAER
jgi:hypothetical protein